jgi:hypothetical protein
MAGKRPNWRLIGFESNLAAQAPALKWGLHWGTGLGQAFKRCDRVNLDRARMRLGLDGVAFWRQLCAVPADDTALPRGARLFANAVAQPKRRGKSRLDLLIV